MTANAHFTTSNQAMRHAFWLNLSLIASLIGLNAPVALAQSVPDELEVPANQQLLFKVQAEGYQVYTCAVDRYANRYAWTLKAPEATLFSDAGQRIGSHYAGPTWEAQDGSRIIGQVAAKVNPPEETAIPWLLLQVRSHQGYGVFSPVNWVQRLHTSGGKAPAYGCDRAHRNEEVRVGYSADYYFYGLNANRAEARNDRYNGY